MACSNVNGGETGPSTQKKAVGEDLEDQINELIALQSIYENEDMEICDHDNPQGDMPGGIIDIPIYPLQQPFEVKITKDHQGIKHLAFWRPGHHAEAVRGRGRRERHILHMERPSDLMPVTENNNKGNNTAQSIEKLYSLKRLPPITLTFAFPHDYPSISAPKFTVSCCWLEKRNLSLLCEKLDTIWEECEGTSVVMNWITALKDESFSFLGIKSPYDLGRVLIHIFTHPAKENRQEPRPPPLEKKYFDDRGIQTFSSIDDVLTKVLDFDLITCDVCFEEKAGEKFLRLYSCDEHTLCKECMRGWLEEQIKEGAVSHLTCPGYKCEKPVLPTEVEQVVSRQLYERYDRLLLKTAFDTMRDIAHCPRRFCQFPVVLEDNLGLCPKCNHAFCGRCQNTYHGHSPCKLKADMFASVCKEYESSSGARRLELETRYGKQTIQRALEENRTEKWLESNSKQCPNCGTSIQKKDGCNKMTCSNCRAFFCWLCQEELSRSNPYAHYQHPTSPCSNRLFEGVEMKTDGKDDDDEDDDDYLMQLLAQEGFFNESDDSGDGINIDAM